METVFIAPTAYGILAGVVLALVFLVLWTAVHLVFRKVARLWTQRRRR